MKRQTLTLLLLFVAVFAVFGGYYALLRRDQTALEHQGEAQRFLSTLAPSAIVELQINSTHVLRQVDGSWRLEGPTSVPVQSKEIDAFVSSLDDVRFSQALQSPKAFASYGLDRGHTLRVSDGKETAILYRFGDLHPFGGKRYVTIDGRPEIYLVDSGPFDDLAKGISPFIDYGILGVEVAHVKGIRFFSGEEARWSLTKKDGGWWLDEGIRADGAEAEKLLTALAAISWSEPPVAVGPPSATMAGKQWFSLTLSESAHPVILAIRPSSDGAWWEIDRSGSPFHYRVKPDEAMRALLSLTIETLHHKDVFAFFPWQLNRIAWRGVSGDARNWHRDGGRFYAEVGAEGAHAVDPEKASDLLERLIHLSIVHVTRIPRAEWESRRGAFGLDLPSVTGTVRWNAASDHDDEGRADHDHTDTVLSQEFEYRLLNGHPYLRFSEDTQSSFVEVFELKEDLASILEQMAAL